jgi:hypothetical protein
MFVATIVRPMASFSSDAPQALTLVIHGHDQPGQHHQRNPLVRNPRVESAC